MVSLKDPGVANWLDPAGSDTGYLMMRWQGLDRSLTATDTPVAEVVPLAKLLDVLPTGHRVSKVQRAEAMAQRQHYPHLKPWH